MKWLHVTAFILLIVGGLNWGLVGLFNFNLVSYLFGVGSMLEAIIYVLVGLSALYLLVMHKKDCKTCMMMTKDKKKK